MNWRLAKSLNMLKEQINTKWPDAVVFYSAMNLDEEGVIRSLVVTHDPACGLDADALAEALRASKDMRIAYVIWNSRIFSSDPDNSPWQWQSYSGTSPHTKYLTVAVRDEHKDYEGAWPAVLATPRRSQ